MKKAVVLVLAIIVIFSISQFIIMAGVKYSYENDIRPLIEAKKCGDCHIYMKMYSRMTRWSTGAIDLHAYMDEDGNITGPIDFDAQKNPKLIIDTAEPDSSLILWSITGLDLSTGVEIPRMPKDGPYYTDGEIQIIKDWISQGAPLDLPVGVEDTHSWLEVKKQFK
ncbi:hypothetical protein ACFL6P_05215 [Candidatus Latescibacterota bacterium]